MSKLLAHKQIERRASASAADTCYSYPPSEHVCEYGFSYYWWYYFMPTSDRHTP